MFQMDPCLILRIFITFCLFESFSTDSANKYSKEMNEKFNKFDDKPFRIQKINILWNKAVKILDIEQLDRLKADLEHQDKIELELKRIKADNHDSSGSKEADVRKQLRMILKKYNLEHEMDIPVINDNDKTNYNENSENLFKDAKLNNLWKKIHKLDLDEEQLKILKEEFDNFENELQNYNRLVNQHNDQHNKRLQRSDIEQNHIDPIPDLRNQDKSLDDLNEKLQQKHLELKDHYQRINDMVYSKDIKYKDAEFEEDKAARLWQMALKSDFNAEELAEIKEKLMHFEKRIIKLNYFENQLKKMKNPNINHLEPSDVTTKDPNIQKHIVERITELDWHVKQLHQQLEEKILARHTEL